MLKKIIRFVLRFLTNLFGGSTDSPSNEQSTGRVEVESLPYVRVENLLSQGERAFYRPLLAAVRDRYEVFSKVRLADVIKCPRDHQKQRSYWGKIKGYHLDFILVDPDTTRPLLAVELDDRSHTGRGGARQRERDRFKDDCLQAAGVPILRVQARQAYAPTELAVAVDRLLGVRSSDGS